MTGWQVQVGYLVTIQPVGTDEARKEALARWSALPEYIDTEIANLREGLKRGYPAPKRNVRIVIDQMDTLASAPGRLAVRSPAVRDPTPAFKQSFTRSSREQLTPAFKRYRDFLEREYLPAARETIAVPRNPERRRAATTARSARTARCRCRPRRSTSSACGRSSASTARCRPSPSDRSRPRDVPALLERLRTDQAVPVQEPRRS